MKKILLILFLVIPISVSARGKTRCDYKLVSNLKKLVSNVDITYTYHINDNDVLFDITLANIQPDMYFIDSNKKTYYYSDTVDGEITIKDAYSGTFKFSFYSNNSECMNEKLGVKNVNLPEYNPFYSYEECKGIENYQLCKKWSSNNITYNDFVYKTSIYKESLKNNNNLENMTTNSNFISDFVTLYLKYFYLLVPLTIGLIVGIYYLFRFIKNRRNRFDI